MAFVRRALVTGGSSGIGLCIAETLARDGCDVGVLHVGLARDGEDVVGRIRAQGRRGWSRVTNVARSNEVQDAVERAGAYFGGLEILVNCAGIFRDRVVWKMCDEDWQDVIDVNLTGAFHCVRAATPYFRDGGWGAIVNVSSINGLRGKFGQSNYSASKAGLIGLTKAVARELARFNVTVNAVAPGYVDTPATAKLPPTVREQAAKEILLERVGQPSDVAELVSFLCSDRARFITGEVIRVDGGQWLS